MITSKDPIVFVDDDADDHFIFEEVCTHLGLQNKLRFFSQGDEVLQYLLTTTDKPFIIFCDINMPQMSGLQLRRQINNNKELRDKSIPFVFFSTAASHEQIREAYDLTVQGFFLKAENFSEMEDIFSLILKYWDKCKHPNSVK